jgi:7TM diverse intracellular signalling
VEGTHTLEWVVFGAALISFLYHMVLYIQQRDRYLLLYSNYLFSVTLFVLFKRLTNYESFEYSDNKLAFVFDYPLILYMLVSYVYFISIILEINNNARIIKVTVIGFYATSALFLTEHLYKVFFTDQTYLSREYFLFSKLVLVGFAFVGLTGAWTIRKTIFVRIILGGGFLYAIFSLFTVLSVYFNLKVYGLYQYDFYFIGCILDILMFSSALGYRSQLINKEKMDTKELLIETSKNNERLLLENKSILEAENKEKLAQFELTKKIQDEVGASLSSIHVFADLAAKVIHTDPSKSIEYMSKIAAQSQQLMDETGDILWATHLDSAYVYEELVHKIKSIQYEILSSHNIEVEYILPPYDTDKNMSKKHALDIVKAIKEKFKTAIEENQDHLSIDLVSLMGNVK